MDTQKNMDHGISIVRSWIFDFNYEKALRLTKELLDIIYSPSICKEQVENFETVFFAVRFIWAPGNL